MVSWGGIESAASRYNYFNGALSFLCEDSVVIENTACVSGSAKTCSWDYTTSVENDHPLTWELNCSLPHDPEIGVTPCFHGRERPIPQNNRGTTVVRGIINCSPEKGGSPAVEEKPYSALLHVFMGD